MSGKGGLMRWQAECGHWMVVHSLEPTPKTCPDCIDEVRKSVKLWGRGIEEPLDLPDEDVTDYFDDGTVLPDAALTEMTRIAQMCTEASTYQGLIR